METSVESNIFYKTVDQLIIGKEQMYVLLVDADGNPILDGSGNRQVVALQSTNGRLQVDASITGSLANVEVDMATALFYTPGNPDVGDKVGIAGIPKGGAITVHSGITASVTLANTPEIVMPGYCAGFLSINVDTGTPTFTLDFYGATLFGGTYQKMFKKDSATAQSLTGITASGMYPITGLPDYIKIVPTLTASSGTITVKFMPAVLL